MDCWGHWVVVILGSCRENVESSIPPDFFPPRSRCASFFSSIRFSSGRFSGSDICARLLFVAAGSWGGFSRSGFTSGVTSVFFSSWSGVDTGGTLGGFSSFGGSKTGDVYAGGSLKKSKDWSGIENLNPGQENEILYQSLVLFLDRHGTLAPTHR